MYHVYTNKIKILRLLQIYKNVNKFTFMLAFMQFYTFKKTITQNGKEVHYACDIWKDEGVIFSFTHLLGRLFFACI